MADERTGYARPTGAATVSVSLLVLWTWFVWVGRVRNALTDPALEGWDLWGPLLLSTSFVVLGAVVAGLLVRRRRHPDAASPAASLTVGLRVLAGWTTAVWLVRASDIALGGDHETAFVVVHVVLAAVSIGLSVWAVRSDQKVRTFEHTMALTASQ